MSSITVTATQWDGGWELEIDSDNITQVRTLAKAAEQVRDYLDTRYPEVNHSDWKVNLQLSARDLAARIRESREASIAAQKAQEAAAREAREVLDLLFAENIMATDAAALLGISRGRVSQLKHSSQRRAKASSQ